MKKAFYPTCWADVMFYLSNINNRNALIYVNAKDTCKEVGVFRLGRESASIVYERANSNAILTATLFEHLVGHNYFEINVNWYDNLPEYGIYGMAYDSATLTDANKWPAILIGVDSDSYEKFILSNDERAAWFIPFDQHSAVHIYKEDYTPDGHGDLYYEQLRMSKHESNR